MLSLPLKLTRAQTRLLKKEDLVCVGVGNSDNARSAIFKGERLECYHVDLFGRKVSFQREPLTGTSPSYLYFLPRAKAASLGLTERSDLIVPYVAKPRAPKPAYRYALLGDNLIEKFTPDTYQVIWKSSGPKDEQRNERLSVIESRIKSGEMKELTHAEFVAKINSWGWNEDGTKIVPPAPPKPEPAPVPRFEPKNLGQVWLLNDHPCMVCRIAPDTYRAIGLKFDLGNRYRDNDTIPEGARMIAPTLADYFKNKLDS